MNIHRKDKAKLIEASNENLFSLDIIKSVKPVDLPHQVSEDKNSLISKSSVEGSNYVHKTLYFLSLEDDTCTPKNKDAPFFVYTTLSNCFDGDDDKKMQLSHRLIT
ncbi:hypothetical protein P3X46_004906 [Hevea brasiliensis]|uniref:Uncharacterized protein n=1 Tax=Hevea brasiliensis TaxID=3981 RepID=A0ABQ9MY59_HEVBR|nr:hypothetical protein P3X46_004906 [Hevea brasiliensis]